MVFKTQGSFAASETEEVDSELEDIFLDAIGEIQEASESLN